MQLKRLWFPLLVAALTLSMLLLPISAADDSATGEPVFALTVGANPAVSAEEGALLEAGSAVDVSVTIEENPGVAVLQFTLKYDPNVLTPVVDESGKWNVQTGIYSFYDAEFKYDGVRFDLEKGEVVVTSSLTNSVNLMETGSLLSLPFVVNESFDGTSSVEVVSYAAYNNTWDKVATTIQQLPMHVHHCGEGVVVAPTCVEDGYTLYTCTTCQNEFHADVVACVGAHEEVAIEAVAPTCSQVGWTEGVKCGRCDEVLVAPEQIDKVPHTWGDEADCEHAQACTVCGAENPDAPAKGHTPVKVERVEPTCTKTGLAEGEKCSVCNKILKEQAEIPATGHTEAEIDAVAPTCTEKGHTAGKSCSACGAVIVEPTDVEATGHKSEVMAAIAATCTKTGLTEGAKCSACDAVLTPQDIVPVIPHTEEVMKAVEPTYSKEGLTEGKKCSVCDTILTAQETVPTKSLTWLWILIVVVVVVAAAVVVYFFVFRKKEDKTGTDKPDAASTKAQKN